MEKGILPKNYNQLIKKVESFLGINIFVDRPRISSGDIVFEAKNPRGIMIDELKAMGVGNKVDEFKTDFLEKEKRRKVNFENENPFLMSKGSVDSEEILEKDKVVREIKEGFEDSFGKKNTFEEEVRDAEKKGNSFSDDQKVLSDGEIDKLIWGK